MPSLDPLSWDKYRVETLVSDVGFGPKRMARSNKAVVAAHHPLSAYAGLQALSLGGTVADALVTMVALDTVVLPGTSTLAGTMSVILHEAATDRTHALNAGLNSILDDDAPYDHLRDHQSGQAVLVPGTIAGLRAMWSRFGQLLWRDLWLPAIHFAREGFPMYGFYHSSMLRRLDVLLRHPEGRSIFVPSGELPAIGETFRQPGLAVTLERLAESGEDYAYRGEWADKLVSAVRRIGGRMSIKDLQRYRVRWDEPTTGTYLGYEIRTTCPPHYGGTVFLLAMNIAEALDLHERPPRSQSARTMFDEIQIYKAAVGSEDLYLDLTRADPMQVRRLRYLLSKPHAHDVAEGIRSGGAPSSRRDVGGHSHHVVAIDASGNVLSATHTIESDSWEDTGLFVDGIPLNSAAYQLNNYRPEPGGRIAEPLCDYIALSEGKPVLAAGAISAGLFPAVIQNTLNVLAHGMGLDISVNAPRWGCYDFDLDTLRETEAIQVEDFDEGLLDEVEALGQPLARGKAADTGFWMAAGLDASTNERLAVTDPRLTGLALEI